MSCSNTNNINTLTPDNLTDKKKTITQHTVCGQQPSGGGLTLHTCLLKTGGLVYHGPLTQSKSIASWQE